MSHVSQLLNSLLFSLHHIFVSIFHSMLVSQRYEPFLFYVPNSRMTFSSEG